MGKLLNEVLQFLSWYYTVREWKVVWLTNQKQRRRLELIQFKNLNIKPIKGSYCILH